MSGYSSELLNDQNKHHWSVKLFDRKDGLSDRNAHFDQHKARLTQFKKDHPGVIGKSTQVRLRATRVVISY